MDAKTKKQLIIGSIILLLLILLAWYFYKRGKRTTTIQQAPGQLPGQGSNGPNISGASNDELKTLSQELYQDMSGYNWIGHDIEPYQRALALNDGDLVKLYNAFNTLYQADSKQTLKQWIEGEKYFNHEVTDALLLKMAKLNLI